MYSKKYNATNKQLILRDDLFCQFCNKQCKNLSSLKQHIIRCKNNPDHISFHIPQKDTFGTSRGWAKGLTKETDSRVAKVANTLHKRYVDGSLHIWCEGQKLSDNTKDKISAALKGNVNWVNSLGKAGVGLKGTYKGIRCDSSFELAYVLYCLDQNKDIKRCNLVFDYILNGKNRKYHPDFIVDGVITEIKGFWQQNLSLKIDAVKKTGTKIKVYLPEDMEPIIKYVFEKYNVHSGKELATLYDR